MRLHRFLCEQDLIGPVLRLEDEKLLHQWIRVLRYAPGQQVLLCNGRGLEVRATLLRCSGTSAELQVEETILEDKPPVPALTLCFSLLKREHTELVLEKGTELGVSVFQPILCARTVKEGLNIARAKRILCEAMEQSGRRWLPELREVVEFSNILKRIPAHQGYFASLTTDSVERRNEESVVSSIETRSLFIGPEGGWTPEEEGLAKEHGLKFISLSKQVLRAETACLAGVVLLLQ